MTGKSALDLALSDNENIDLQLSYSKVSDFDRNGPSALLPKAKKESEALKKGSLVDDLLFNKDKFDEIYYVSEFNEPTASLGVLSKIILDNFTEVPNIETIENIVNINDLWIRNKDKDKRRANWDIPEFWGYINNHLTNVGKILVTREEIDKAEKVVEVLKTHPFSENIFNPKFEHIYQHGFEIKINQFTFRGFIDIITIDHENKIIYFKDLKTGGASSSEFSTSFIKWRYYLQEAVYCLAFEEVCNKLGLKGYTLASFEFVYIGLKEQIPVSYIVTPQWHNAALYGFKTTNGYRYKGLYELIDDIYFHWKNKIYDLPREVYQFNGRINLEDSFIKLVQDEV